MLAGVAAAQPSDGDVRAAARAFEEGQRAQLERDYARAAQLFEVAHRAAPAPAALRSAIRNHEAGGAHARAATLSLEAIARYATDAPTRTLATQVLSDHEAELGRVTVRCDSPCGVLVDGSPVSLRSVTQLEFFVDAGAHTVGAAFDSGGTQEAQVEVAAGGSESLSLVAPEVEEPTLEPVPDPPPREREPGEFRREPLQIDRESRRGWSPVGAWIGIGATAALGAVLVWSIVDLFDTSDSFKANPSPELFESGQDKIRRTWILGVTTGVVAIGTLLIAVLATDWSGGDEDTAWVPQLELGREGGTLGVVGRFGGLR